MQVREQESLPLLISITTPNYSTPMTTMSSWVWLLKLAFLFMNFFELHHPYILIFFSFACLSPFCSYYNYGVCYL